MADYPWGRDEAVSLRKRDFRKMTEWFKMRFMKFGHMWCYEPSFTSLHGILRKHPFLTYVLHGHKCFWNAPKNRVLPQDWHKHSGYPQDLITVSNYAWTFHFFYSCPSLLLNSLSPPPL